MSRDALPPVRGGEIQLRPGRRIFLVKEDEHFDNIAWGGLVLSFADGLAEADLAAPMVAMPKWNTRLDESTGLLLTRLGERVRQWWQRGPRGRRPKDPMRWLGDLFTHPSRPPLHASREELACAVAYATHHALASCYRYAVRELVQRARPPLNDFEQDLFRFYHWHTGLLGIPINTLRCDYRELISETVNDLLRRRINGGEARSRIWQILAQHGLLKDESLEHDRARYRRRRDHERAQEQQSRLRNLSRRRPNPR